MAESDIDPRILEIITRLEVVEAVVNNSKGPTNDAETVSTSDVKEDSKSNGDIADKVKRLKLALAEFMTTEGTLEGSKITNATSAEPEPEPKPEPEPESEPESESESEPESEPESVSVKIIPQLNRVNWTQFKNSVAGETRRYTIDVLIGPVKSRRQRRQEHLNLQRGGLGGSTLNSSTFDHASSQPVGLPTVDTSTATDERTEAQIETPERIRINCEKLLSTLSDIAGSSVGPEPIIMIRPYKLLVRYDDDIRQRLQELETQCREAVQEKSSQDRSTNDEQLSQSTTDGGVNGNQETSEKDKSVTDNEQHTTSTDSGEYKTERDGLKCLIEFMDAYITPVCQKYQSDISKPKRIPFRDLWYLYRPGDLVVTRENIDGNKNRELDHATGYQAPTSQLPKKSSENKNKEFDGVAGDQLSSQSTKKGPPAIWRVVAVSRGRPDLDDFHNEAYRLRAIPPKVNEFRVLCHAIAYDGTSFGPIRHTFDIVSFDGLKDISTLDPCPLRYVENHEEIETRLVERGKSFMQYTRPTHRLYVGLTLTNLHLGYICSPSGKNTMIDGPVIVDFKEAALEDESWIAELDMGAADQGVANENNEDYPRYIWKDKTFRVTERVKSESIYDDDYVDARDMDDFVASNTFLSAFKNSPTKDNIDHRSFERVDFALLPDRVIGFDFYRRKFCVLALDCLHPVRVRKEGWDDLKLPSGHKNMVQAQVRTHFLRKQSQQSHASRDVDIDLVRGKGLGLIILLHGAPGVGKTSTAECVAETLGKPLYPITCGDLGDTAESVENTLARTFSKAEAWDCVLLLDEADVFLAQRTRTDLKRNAIVSVFLRVLEYYKGTLILTTNRVGAFDEAFKSRIHLQLYYPALNKGQTLAIWEVNLKRVLKRNQGCITADVQEIEQFAGALFDQQKQRNTRWNGRQIRNAFQTAVAMAKYEALVAAGSAESQEDSVILENLPSRLKVSHFATVADASLQFDEYIEETTGGTDGRRAFEERIRADNFKYMAPRGVQSHYQNAQWSMGVQGEHTQTDPDPFVQKSSRFRQGEHYDWQESASMQASFHQSHTSPGSTQPWTGIGASPGPPTQEAEATYRYLPRGTEPHVWEHNPDNGEYRFRNPAYSQVDGVPPQTLSTPPNHDFRSTMHRPVTPIISQRRNEDGY